MSVFSQTDLNEQIPEHVYRRIVAVILNSPPDNRVYCLPYQLLEHIKTVFNYEENRHDEIVAKEEEYRPQYELRVSIADARNLGVEIQPHPYCLLTVTNKADENPRGRSRTSRSPSTVMGPQLSPNTLGVRELKKRPSDASAYVPETTSNIQYSACSLTDTANAVWDEDFIFALGDTTNRFFNLYVIPGNFTPQEAIPPASKDRLHKSLSASGSRTSLTAAHSQNDISQASVSPRRTKRHGWLEGIMGNFLTVKGEESVEHCGCAFVSIKELQLNRPYDRWLNLSPGRRSSNHTNLCGSVHAKLRLTVKARSYWGDHPESENFNLYEMVQLVHRFHAFSAGRQQEEYNIQTFGGEILEMSDAVLEQICSEHHISNLTRRLLSMALILSWNGLYPDFQVNEQAFNLAFERLQVAFYASPFPQSADESMDFTERPACSDWELDLLQESLSSHMERVLNSTHCERHSFFPPSPSAALMNFNKQQKVIMNLCNLELWQWTEQKPYDKLRAMLRTMIERDTESWLANRLRDADFLEASAELKKASAMADIIDEITASLDLFLVDFHKFFGHFDVNYREVVLTAIDKQLSEICRQTVDQMTRSAMAHPMDSDLELFSKISMRLCLSLKYLAEYIANENCVTVTICRFEEWFCGASIYWTYTWKDTSQLYTIRALRQDRELDKAADDVDYAESVVNVLAICKALCDDFVKLGFSNVCMSKTFKIICDNIVGYARYLCKLTENYCRSVSSGLNKLRVMRAANSIERAGLYIKEKLPEFLAYDDLFSALEETERPQIQLTLEKLLQAQNEKTHAMACSCVKLLVRQGFGPEIEKHSTELMLSNAEWTKTLKSYMRQVFAHERADNLMKYLMKCVHACEGHLQQSILDCALSEIWGMTEEQVEQKLARGQPPEYYEQIIEYGKALKVFFSEVIEQRSLYCTLSRRDRLRHTIFLNSLSTEALMLDYYATLADKMEQRKRESSPCIVNMELGYQRITNERISITIRVLNGRNFPVLDPMTQSCDPYIRLELCPVPLFPPSEFKTATTAVQNLTLNPDFDQTFQFDIPLNSFYTHGAVLCVTGIDHDVVSSNDVAGLTYIHLAKIPKVEIREVESGTSVEETLSPLVVTLHPLIDYHIPSFEVLKERISWDAAARELVYVESYLLHYKSLPPFARDDNDASCSGIGLGGRMLGLFYKSKERFSKKSVIDMLKARRAAKFGHL